MLKINSLSTSYGGIRALQEVSLEIPERGIVALIGSNGAGKSTLLKTICGLVAPQAGIIVFDGEDITRRDSYKIARSGLLLVPEGRQILGPLTVEENLELGRLAAGSRSRGDRDLQHVYELFPVLAQRRKQEGGSLSGGQQQMLAIGRALMGCPKLLLLDEPSLGLSPLLAKQVFAALEALNREGLTIFLVEQNAQRALASTSHAFVLERGRVVHQGASSELINDPKVIAHYLGREDE
ncbi:MAG: ABC transporter ATP-binding protein [Candidimonas sp.]